MESAELERTTVDVVSADRQITLRATGTVTLFDGFLTLYQEGKDDEDDEDGAKLPQASPPATTPPVEKVTPGAAFHRAAAALFRSQPGAQAGRARHRPAFDLCHDPVDAARPRLCAHGPQPLHSRRQGPARHRRSSPVSSGRYVEYGFTADLEEKLDEVSAGELDWKQLLRDFWKDFSAAVGETKDLKISQVIDELDEILGPHIFPPGEDGADPRICPACGNGRLSLKLGRFGAFVGCSNYPECRFTRQLGAEAGRRRRRRAARARHRSRHRRDRSRCAPAASGLMCSSAKARSPSAPAFPKAPTPRMSISNWRSSCCRCRAKSGMHPEDGKPITANFGRFGPYVAHDGKYASLESPEDVFTVGLNRAVTLLAEKKAKGAARRGREALKELGADPQRRRGDQGDEGPLWSLCHRRHDQRHLPRRHRSDAVTLEQALALIAERAAKGGGKKKKQGRAKAESRSRKRGEEAARSRSREAAPREESQSASRRKSAKRKPAAGE